MAITNDCAIFVLSNIQNTYKSKRHTRNSDIKNLVCLLYIGGDDGVRSFARRARFGPADLQSAGGHFLLFVGANRHRTPNAYAKDCPPQVAEGDTTLGGIGFVRGKGDILPLSPTIRFIYLYGKGVQ